MHIDRTIRGQPVELLVPSMHCAGCMRRIEDALTGQPGIFAARANLSRRRVVARIDPALTDAEALIATLARDGHAARPFDPGIDSQATGDTGMLVRIGIAGFAAMNIMLLSIGVWSGADGATRDLLHWVSALIAIPAVLFCGRPFFASAFAALAHRRVNMDVPISLAIVLAVSMSIIETLDSGKNAYFDAAVMLIFFLLIGRYLEHRMRAAARSAAEELAALTGRTATRVWPDGRQQRLSVGDLQPGMILSIAAGERVPATGVIVQGQTDLDRALLTGECDPIPAATGDQVQAGTLNLGQPIRIRVTATGDDTALGEIARLVDSAERGQGRFDRLADQWARYYVLIIHILAAATLFGWLLMIGSWLSALAAATAVLIITCPCALALAIPSVHTAVAGRLFKAGVFLKNGEALERLSSIDTVVFDKTGTLTKDRPELVAAPPADDPAWPAIAALAAASRHPFSRAIADRGRELGISPARLGAITELPGLGMQALFQGAPVRLGRPKSGSGVTFTGVGTAFDFRFAETLRSDARQTCDALAGSGYRLAILSGDNATRVGQTASALGIDDARAGLLPQEKLAWLNARSADGARILMVGDGLNDAPVLAAADASISPGSGADIAKTAADLVFTGNGLEAVATALDAAALARRRSMQCLAIAIAYNAIAVPVAVAGLVTPLFAAIAMSASSLIVVANAIRPGRAP